MSQSLAGGEAGSLSGPWVVALAMCGVSEKIVRGGADPDRVFGDVGLPVRIDDPMQTISLVKYCRLLETASAHTGDPAFGLRAGLGFRPRDFGALGYVIMNAPTFGVGLRKLCEHFPIYQGGSQVRLIRDGDHLRLEYRIEDGRISIRRQDAELTLALFAAISRHCLGRGWSFSEVHFEHQRPDDITEHRRVFDAPIYFGERTNALVFDAAVQAVPLADPDPFVMTTMEAYLAGRRPDAATEMFAARLRHAVNDGLAGGGARVQDVARAMGLTRAQLLRRMVQRQIDFQALVRDLRRERALHLLSEPHVPLTDIAEMLGYSELSAFSRAFRNWTGVSPLRYRRDGQAARAGSAA